MTHKLYLCKGQMLAAMNQTSHTLSYLKQCWVLRLFIGFHTPYPTLFLAAVCRWNLKWGFIIFSFLQFVR